MHDNNEVIIDIEDFQKKLCEAFETKGVLSQFKNENVPAPHKNLAVQEAKVKTNKKPIKLEETPELNKKLISRNLR